MTSTGDSNSAAERAYLVTRERIIDGTHQPDTMLSESALAADLGVSRTPVRVALARLQDEGWITVYPKRGALVQGVTERTVAELADARFVLETTAVDRASDTLRQRLADRLEASIEQQRQALADRDLRSFIALTIQFHRGFVEAGDNRVVVELYGQLADRHRFVLFAAGDHLFSRAAEIIAEHETLTQQLRAGNPTEFAATLRRHITNNAPPGGSSTTQ